ncbi:1-acyl-sn-glycerol-3-phosphate acyltransferase [Acutalibacter sp. 1XD8-33]|uniref:lysophospholipid acyltransferase family protein n=1 Tax=Acutalibacter sp. 1XD8-33 TaxID=2320081 RepID=UPI000EA034A3|nr:lysophospholipid acyltransferase family protein [Acutalibacter sp. 1XD8-33]RKJ39944.1 1-acyl-sn-glycerol-3-phosphate acyltransferase [Acutalibacter sp. 1XD8-33]
MKSKPKRKGLVYAIGQFFLTLFYYPVFRLHVRGRENVPRTGPVLLCCNHMAKRDPVMLGVSVRRQVFYMAKEELFENWFIGGILRSLGAFPVRRGTGGADALADADQLLEENAMVGVFIEGTRSKDGRLQKPKTGAALLAYRSGAQVVPVCITAGDGGLPKKFKRHIVNIGKPIPAEKLAIPDDSGMQLRKASRMIMAEIAALREETLKELGLPSQLPEEAAPSDSK